LRINDEEICGYQKIKFGKKRTPTPLKIEGWEELKSQRLIYSGVSSVYIIG